MGGKIHCSTDMFTYSMELYSKKANRNPTYY